MKKPVVILPLDGYKRSQDLFSALDNFLASPGISSLLAFVKINDGIHSSDYPSVNVIKGVRTKIGAAGSSAGIFLDLKIFDVSATLENTLKKYIDCPPDILTVSSNCSVDGIIKLRRLLPKTKLAMVSVLTDISEDECLKRHGLSPELKIYSDLINIKSIYKDKIEETDNQEPFDFLVCSARELRFLKKNLPSRYGFIVPGIRDEWMKSVKEHQKRTTGAKQALEAGATLLVMGAQLTKGNPERNISPEESQELTFAEINKVNCLENVFGDVLSVLKDCGAYYCSPKDEEGNITGLLVAYAGTYMDNQQSKNFVGPEYYNIAQAESNPYVIAYLANIIKDEMEKSLTIPCDVLLGAPMGGIKLATILGEQLGCRSIFAEKKVVALADVSAGLKEESRQVIDRHKIDNGNNVVIVEDVCNNFSTTQKLKELIEGQGGKLIAIVCAVNRSGLSEWEGIPVLSAAFLPTQQFKQDDDKVKDLIAAGKIVWKPKAEWEKLQEAMDGK